MDRYDRQILNILQEDAAVPVAEIGERVGLTSTPCWRRVQKLEASGIIRKRVALLDAARLNVGVTVFVSIRTSQHNVKWLKAFHDLVASIPEVTEFYRMAGDADYLLRVVVPDIAALERFILEQLSPIPQVEKIRSSFTLKQVRYKTALPLG